MASTVPEEYLVVFLRVTRGSSNDSWQPCVPLILRILDTFLGWWISKNGTDPAGPIMQKVRSFLLHGTTCTFQLSPGLFILSAGIWLSPKPDTLPILTLFGSTNLNSRSAQLDTELSFMMLANSVAVRKKLQLELQGLNEFAEDWKGEQRNVRAITKILARLLSGYL